MIVKARRRDGTLDIWPASHVSIRPDDESEKGQRYVVFTWPGGEKKLDLKPRKDEGSIIGVYIVHEGQTVQHVSAG